MLATTDHAFLAGIDQLHARGNIQDHHDMLDLPFTCLFGRMHLWRHGRQHEEPPGGKGRRRRLEPGQHAPEKGGFAFRAKGQGSQGCHTTLMQGFSHPHQNQNKDGAKGGYHGM